MTIRTRPLPTCLPVRPAILVAATRGAVGRMDETTIEVVRAIRDHRDDLADEVVAELLRVICSGPTAYRAVWGAALRELRRPSLTERARTRAARGEQAAR